MSDKLITLEGLDAYNTELQNKIDKKLNDKLDKSGGEVTGTLNLPNSPDRPETAAVVDTYSMRQTADARYTVVDDSNTVIEKVQGETIKSSNLFDISKAEKGNIGSYSIEGNNILFNPLSSTVDGFAFVYWADVKPNTDYQIKYLSKSVDRVYVYTDELFGNLIGMIHLGSSFNTGENSRVLIGFYSLKSLRDGAVETISNIMLNEGSTALPYEPYFSGLKNAYFEGVKSTGKNLFDINNPLLATSHINYFSQYSPKIENGIIYNGGVYGKSRGVEICVPVKKNTDYVFSFNAEIDEAVNERYAQLIGFSNLGQDNVYSSSKTISSIAQIKNGINSLTVNSGDWEYIGIAVWGLTQYSIAISKLQIEQGISATNYEPYKESNLSLSIPVELGKWDYIDFERRKVVRGTKTVTFTGTENWLQQGTGANDYGIYSYQVHIDSPSNNSDAGICNNYEIEVKSFNNASTEHAMVHNTGYVYFRTFGYTTVDEWKAHLAELYANGNPLTISYELATPIEEDIYIPTDKYTVWNGGSETVIQGETDNSELGAVPTITQIYNIHDNPIEAATHAYVQNGLAKKLDKSGGTITGTLIVEDGIDSTLSALVVKNGEATYGLTLEDDTYKLGKGSVDENNNFTFDNGEGLPVALRDDSSAFTNDSLVSWSEEGNKFVDSGIAASTISNKVDKKEFNVIGRRAYIVNTTLNQETGEYVNEQTYNTIATSTANATNGAITSYIINTTNHGDSAFSSILLTGTPKRNYHAANKKYVDDKFTNGGEVTGYLTLPNAPTTPEDAIVTDTYIMRQTANPEITGLTVVDDSDTVVESVQGETVKSSNLIPFPYSGITDGETKYGITYSIDSNGVITASGTATGSYNLTLRDYFPVTVGQTFSFSSGIADISNYRLVFMVYDSNKANPIYANENVGGRTYTIQEGGAYGRLVINFSSSATLENVVFKPMLNEGSTALHYKPYFSGLKNAYFEGVKSTGKNLIDINAMVNDCLVDNGDGSYTISKIEGGADRFSANYYVSLPAGTYQLSATVVKSANTVYLRAYYTDGTFSSTNVKVDSTATATFEKEVEYLQLFLSYTSTVGQYCTFKDLMLTFGGVNQDYEPYTEIEWKLPTPVELGKWDYIDFERKKIVRGTETVVYKGTESWKLQSVNDNGIYNYQIDAKGITGLGGICNLYNIQWTEIANTTEEGFMLTKGGGGVVFFRTKSYITVDEWKAHLAELYANGNPLVISYELTTPIEEDIDIPTDKYTVWHGGTETVIQGENDNSTWDAIPTITQKYSIHENPKEVAIKEYVNNGLAKKLDKTGGTITGNLIVEGKTETALGAIISKKDNIVYGLAYDNEAFKLGLGELSEDGDFAFAEGEGLPIALRDDSDLFDNGALVAWSSDGNKLIDSGITKEVVDNKVDKLTPSATGRRVYAYDASDPSVTSYSLSGDIATTTNGKIPFYRNNSLTAGAVPQHRTNKIGTLYVNKPLSNYEAANKAYVDEKAGDATIATFSITEANTTITLINLIGMTCIDWGDDTIPSASLTHTYANVGEYKCIIYGVTEIGVGAFESEYHLSEIIIGNIVTKINEYAFYDTKITSIIIPNSVTSIGAMAFEDSNLTKITIPDSVMEIGSTAFGTSTLMEVEFKSTTPEVYDESCFEFATNLKRIIVPHESYEAYKTAWTDYATLIDSYVLMSDLKSEEWTFTLTDGSTVTKKVVIL